jgi:hypothetical protein
MPGGSSPGPRGADLISRGREVVYERSVYWQTGQSIVPPATKYGRGAPKDFKGFIIQSCAFETLGALVSLQVINRWRCCGSEPLDFPLPIDLRADDSQNIPRAGEMRPWNFQPE